MATAMARAQAKSQLEHIVRLIQSLRAAQDTEDEAAEDAVREEIDYLPLEVLVRSGWHRPGEDAGPEEYQIVLGTGCPAVRITGALDSWREPVTAVLEYADWWTPWTAYPADVEEELALLEFARQFYYGYGG